MQADLGMNHASFSEADVSSQVRHTLRAGPISLTYQDGEIRYLRLGSHEVVRRIYVTVRDENWATILPNISNLQIHAQDDAFELSFDARHRERNIDFLWKGYVCGNTLGKVRFSIDGFAQTSFLQSRVGICVLHPIRELAGMPCLVRHTDGSKSQGVFPYHVSPHQPLMDICAIEHELEGDLKAIIEFEGGVFEMEDQRNWADGSYKTYSPPLTVPYPSEMEAFTKVHQSVSIELAPTQASRRVSDAPSRIVLKVGSEVVSHVPGIGLTFANKYPQLTKVQQERLKRMKLDHLRVDLHLSRSDYAAALELASEQAQALEVPLLLGVTISDNAQLRELVPVLERVKPRVAAWLIFDAEKNVAGPELLACAREQLQKYSRSALMGMGSNRNFVELNRAAHLPTDVDFLCYPMNPQVHRFDDDTLIESLQAHKWLVDSAKRLAPGRSIFVTPVSFTSPFLENNGDPRQCTLFGAAWMLGSLKYITEAGATSATYFETKGTRGVLSPEIEEAGAESSQLGSVFPIYHVLADFSELAGAEVLASHSTVPLKVEILAMRHSSGLRLLCANFADEPESILITGLPTQMRTARIRTLDATSVDQASRSPEDFREAAATQVIGTPGKLELDLPPLCVVCVDEEV